MLELLFGNQQNFATAFTVICMIFLTVPFVVSILSGIITSFVTRGKSTKYLMWKYNPFSWCGQDIERWNMIEHVMAPTMFLVVGSLVSLGLYLLGNVIYMIPVWGYIAIGSVLGVLFTARFAYTLYSKFDDHMKKLHKVSDSDEEYKAKW